ncbi:type IV toxin-antitoxin system AbiEi family antitoxin domain-containing protein, partial [Bacteroides sp. 51]|uniref:type IV toxin-antitoxin system AbiEi family antitoxin domain-containing protein n=1 Tax=Bacteroides sp. 51 TaxID=2302938 RepID=UPI0013D271E3
WVAGSWRLPTYAEQKTFLEAAGQSPVSKMLQSEKDKLLHLEDELHKRVIGQDEAIEQEYPDAYITKANLYYTGNLKVKRMFLYMAEKAGHYWFDSLDIEKI